MHEPCIVRVLQTGTRLKHERHGSGVRKLSTLSDRFARDVLHDDVRAAVRLTRVVHLDDVRMREPAREPRFLQEACTEVVVARQMFREHLDRNPAVELFVMREVDDRHAAVPKRPLDPVPAVRKRPGQSSLPCFFLSLCLFSCLCGFATGEHWMRDTRSPTVEPSCSWDAAGTRPALIAVRVSCWSCCARLSARQESPAASV